MKLTAFVAALLLGSTAMAQTAAPAAPTWTFALHGFVSMSMGLQDGNCTPSCGQQSLAATTAASPVPDKSTFTADVRQSRFNFSVKGPQVLGGATPSAVLEIDFMQGWGPGRYGDVSLLNRLRLAYSELNWGAFRVQAGQQNDLSFAMAPTSLSHIAFPIGYFTGNIGWRRPGVFGYYTAPIAPDFKIELAAEVGRSQWADLGNTATNAPNGIGGASTGDPGGFNLGEASGGPAVQGRISLAYAKYLTAFVATHYQNIDRSGYGAVGAASPNKNTVSTTAYNAGLKLTLPIQGDIGLTVAGTGFMGSNIGPLIGNLTTGAAAFNLGPNGESVDTTGWWAQVGLNLTKEFSLWGFYGMQSIDKKDFVRAGAAAGAAYENTTTNVIAMYRDGGYGISAEWLRFDTKLATGFAGGTVGTHRTATADQYLLSANYFF